MKPISTYDEVSFPSYPHSLSHPERLATVARLRGWDAPPIERCRVLELGSDTGGNLIPLAETLPHSEFLGIDLAESRVSVASEHARNIQLTNISFESRDILDWHDGGPPFDYILCHGVFSWTTDPSRNRILELCRELLSPRGVAYINYNTFPGWHLQGMLRDMLCFHASRWSQPAERVAEARAIIDFLLAVLPPQGSPYATLLRNELEGMRQNSDPFLFHAYLNVVNQPFYLHQFVDNAEKLGLQYLGDADPEAMWPGGTSTMLEQQLSEIAKRGSDPARDSSREVYRFEQYYDFVRFSMSRRSLLVKAPAAIRERPRPEDLEGMHVSAFLSERTPPQGAPAGAALFLTHAGRSITVTDPVLTSILRQLAQAWPESRPWESLDDIAAGVAPAGSTSAPRWQSQLLRCFMAGIIEVSVRPNPSTRAAGKRPRATRFARHQAVHQDFVANLRHSMVRLSDFDRRVLQHLDGSRTDHEILSLIQMVPGNVTPDLETVRQSVSRLAAQALLLDPGGGGIEGQGALPPPGR